MRKPPCPRFFQFYSSLGLALGLLTLTQFSCKSSRLADSMDSEEQAQKIIWTEEKQRTMGGMALPEWLPNSTIKGSQKKRFIWTYGKMDESVKAHLSSSGKRSLVYGDVVFVCVYQSKILPGEAKEDAASMKKYLRESESVHASPLRAGVIAHELEEFRLARLISSVSARSKGNRHWDGAVSSDEIKIMEVGSQSTIESVIASRANVDSKATLESMDLGSLKSPFSLIKIIKPLQVAYDSKDFQYMTQNRKFPENLFPKSRYSASKQNCQGLKISHLDQIK